MNNPVDRGDKLEIYAITLHRTTRCGASRLRRRPEQGHVPRRINDDADCCGAMEISISVVPSSDFSIEAAIIFSFSTRIPARVSLIVVGGL